MKNEKIIKFLKIFIVVLVIILAIAIPVSLITYDSDPEIKSNECIQKGKVCTADEIFDGVEVLVEVKKGKKYVFNVIYNDEKSMTLLMNENLIKESDWHGELVNIKGPRQALIDLYLKITDWKNVEPISFMYKDEGKLSFEEFCATGNVDPGYDCTNTTYLSRGYDYIEINNGVTTINMNLVEEDPSIKVENVYTQSKRIAYARLITLSEINNLSKDFKYPEWLTKNLKDNEGYWTLTSSTAMRTGYQQGAIALAKVEGKASVESLFVQGNYQPDFTIGVRPVITIEKK